MDNCIIQLEVDHCSKSSCGGPSVTNVGVFKNESHAKRFMSKDKTFKKYFGIRNIKKRVLPIAIWAVPGDK